MDATNNEIGRLMERLIELTNRNAARCERMIQVLDSFQITGRTASPSSTSVGSDVCDSVEVPAPVYPNPLAEVTPASPDSDSDANLVTIDAAGATAPTRIERPTVHSSGDTTEPRSAPAPTTAPTVHTPTGDFEDVLSASAGVITTAPTTCSMEGLSRDTTELRPASAVYTDTFDIVVTLAAPATTDRTAEDQAINGVSSTPAMCSTVCLPRYRVAAPVLVASLSPTLIENGLHTNGSSVAAVPLAMTAEFPAALAPMASAPVFPMQQLYIDSNFFMPTSGQRSASMVPRPMPWPSFMGVHDDRVEARPWPWPSLWKTNGCEFPSDVVEKASWRGNSDSSPGTLCDVIKISVTDLNGNLSISTGCIIVHDMCSFGELRYLDEVLLFLGYWWSFGNYVQLVHTMRVQLLCTISGILWLVMIRSIKLKLLPSGSTSVTLLAVLLDSGTFAALSVALVCFSGSQELDHYLCSSQLQKSVVLYSRRRSNSSYDQFVCAIQSALCWPVLVWPKKKHSELIPERARIQLQPTISGMYLCLSACIQALVLVLCNICSMHTIRSSKCMHVTKDTQRSVQSLGGPNYFLNSKASVLCDMHLIMVKSKQQVAVYCSCLAYCHLGLGTNTTGYSDCKDSMMVVNNSAISNHVKEFHGPYVSAQMQWGDIASVLSCGLIHLGKLSLYVNFGRSAVGRPSLCIPCQFVALKTMEPGWSTTAFLTEILSMFSPGFSVQLDVACSVQSMLFTEADQLDLMASTMFSFNWDKLNSIFLTRISRCTFQDVCIISTGCNSKHLLHKALIGIQLKLNVSTMNWFLSGLDPGCVVCLQELQRDNTGIEAAASKRVITSVNPYQSKWSESILAHCSASEGKFCENKLEFYNLASYTVVQYTLSSHGIQTRLHSFNVNISRKLMHDSGVVARKRSGNLVQHMKAPWYDQAVFQGGRHGRAITTFEQVATSHIIKVRQLQWDPGRFSAMSAWGQAEFQGGRGVRNPSYASPWAGTWASSAEHGPSRIWFGNYKYPARHNGEGIKTDRGGTTLPPSPLLL